VLGVIVDYYFSNSQQNSKYPWKITNPYSGTSIEASLLICSKETTDEMLQRGIISKGAAAAYNPANSTLNVFPYNLPPTRDRQQLTKELRTYVEHELVHALDPKMHMPRSTPPAGTPEYYSSSVEFDSHSKQITEYLRSEIAADPAIKDMVLNWLRTSQLSADNPMYDFSRAIQAWEQSDAAQGTDLIR
jgi:hypothetical protein